MSRAYRANREKRNAYRIGQDGKSRRKETTR
jgi:hypothetical protein